MSTTTPNSPLLDTTRSRNKSTLHFAGLIVAAHLAVFLGLLLIGCNKENKTDKTGEANPNAGDAGVTAAPGLGNLPGNADTNSPIASTNGPGAYSPTGAAPAGGPVTSAPPAFVPPPVAAPVAAPINEAPVTAAAGAQAYKVKSGDIAYKIAKSHGVSLKALTDANPGVALAKLRIGQEIQIPGAAAAAPATAGRETAMAAEPATTGAGEGTQYVVKGGDNLGKIARHFHTTVKAIRHANHLTSDNIKQGQKLKIPAKAASDTGGGSHAAPPVDAPAAAPVPTAIPAPSASPISGSK